MNLRYRMYNTYDIVCVQVSGPTISYTIYIQCDILHRMYVIRCRSLICDVNKIYDVVPTMSYILFLDIARTIPYVRSDIRHHRCHIRGHMCIPTTSYVTCDIVCGKNPDECLLEVRTVTFKFSSDSSKWLSLWSVAENLDWGL